MDKEKAREEIKKLVDDFKSNYQKYKKELEANTETKLVEPLFQILGWSKNDFIKREKAHRGEKSGFADYAFYIGDKIVFFLEVKKVGISLEKEAYKQVISYALSKRIPFAIATNFEELKIFCVEQEDAINNKFRVFNSPEDYINNFEDLLYLSKESFEQGLILKKAESEGRLRKRVSIDKTLLEDLMQIRSLIASDLGKQYPGKYQINEKEEIIQRILDRLIFIRRCEDIGINPENMLIEDIRRLPDNKAYPKLKEIFKKYNEVYNSGLFAIAKDNDCDKIDINGAIIKKLAYNLYESKDKSYIYNFDWIDADVLGQIYEQYLGKILELTKSGKAKLKDGQVHKKEQGIYYTPTWVVDYIVKNTVGEIIKKLDAKNIKILDPACGSGSFLIKAFDYLYNHFSSNDETKQHRIDSQGAYSIKTEILKNNLYGVDLDNKAVEITKLNLLLKAAEKYRKLPEEVDMRVRNGNSLIDDENDGFHAFKWTGDFKEGSFDAVIGNPPYIRIQTLDEKNVDYFNSHYEAATKNYDIYALFVEKGLSLLKEGGVLGFILPSKFFNADYGAGLRKVIAKNKALYKIVDFKDFQVFESATTYTCLLFLKKSKNKNFEYLELSNKDELNTSSRTLMKFQYKKSIQAQPSGEENWNFVGGENKSIMEKLRSIKLKLGNISENIFQGIITGADKIFILIKRDNGLFYSHETNKEYNLEKELLHPLLKGSKHIRRYRSESTEKFVIFPYKIIDSKATPIDEEELQKKFPKIYNYLHENKTTLQKRDRGKMKGASWYLYSRNQNLSRFGQGKIMTPSIAKFSSFTYDEKSDFFFVGSGGGGGGAYGITLKNKNSSTYILAILNSKLVSYFIGNISSKFSGGYFAFNKQYIEEIPILIPSDKEKSTLSELAKIQLEKNSKLSEFGDKKTSETAKLEEEIKKTDNEIDELVYQLYGITEEEKKIIEESLK